MQRTTGGEVYTFTTTEWCVILSFFCFLLSARGQPGADPHFCSGTHSSQTDHSLRSEILQKFPWGNVRIHSFSRWGSVWMHLGEFDSQTESLSSHKVQVHVFSFTSGGIWFDFVCCSHTVFIGTTFWWQNSLHEICWQVISECYQIHRWSISDLQCVWVDAKMVTVLELRQGCTECLPFLHSELLLRFLNESLKTCWEFWKQLHLALFNKVWLCTLQHSGVIGNWSPGVGNNPMQPPLESSSTNSTILIILV